MKPKPFSALNHFTVPVAMSPPMGQRVALLQNLLRSLKTTKACGSHSPQASYCKGNQTATCVEPSTHPAAETRGKDHVTRTFETRPKADETPGASLAMWTSIAAGPESATSSS